MNTATANQLELHWIIPKERGTVRPRVLQILSKYPESRNDDDILIRKYAEEFHNGDILAGPPLESIVRRRREIQNNEGLYLADPDVQLRRQKAARINKAMFSE